MKLLVNWGELSPRLQQLLEHGCGCGGEIGRLVRHDAGRGGEQIWLSCASVVRA